MDLVELPEGRPAESYHMGIHCQRAIVAQGREVDGLDRGFLGSPSPGTALDLHAKPIFLPEAEVRGQDGHLMPAICQTASKRAHFDDWTAAVLKGEVGLHDHQDPHTFRDEGFSG